MTWLDGWERIEIPGRSGGNYTGDEPWRCVLHSTEGLSIESAVGSYTTNGVPPQCTIDPRMQRKAQHVDTDRSAYAVMNQPGGVETNRWRAIQVEIVMFADQTKAQQYGGLYVGDLTDDHYRFIRGCLLELQADKPFSFDGPQFIHYPDSYGYTRHRMSFGEWERFGGTCGHQHVPENDHGDPGELDRLRLFPATPEDDMATAHFHKVQGSTRLWIAGPEIVTALECNSFADGRALADAFGLKLDENVPDIAQKLDHNDGHETHVVWGVADGQFGVKQ